MYRTKAITASAQLLLPTAEQSACQQLVSQSPWRLETGGTTLFDQDTVGVSLSRARYS